MAGALAQGQGRRDAPGWMTVVGLTLARKKVAVCDMAHDVL
jgi:hypothetical protein